MSDTVHVVAYRVSIITPIALRYRTFDWTDLKIGHLIGFHAGSAVSNFGTYK